MNVYRLIACFLGLSLCLVMSCKEEALEPLPDRLADYYPLELNRPVYYRVDSVVLVRQVNGVRYDSSSTEARETLVETFVGADGVTYYRGERWERANAGFPYRFRQSFTVARTDGGIVRSEDNLTFTKLVSPLREGVRWDGNKAFDEFREIFAGGETVKVYEGWDYQYTNIDTAVTLRTGVQLDSVVTVRQADLNIQIDYRRAYEWYAPGIGLVERFVDARHTQCETCCDRDFFACADLGWNEKAEKGYIVRQTFLGRD